MGASFTGGVEWNREMEWPVVPAEGKAASDVDGDSRRGTMEVVTLPVE
jgi:hypothetical protein